MATATLPVRSKRSQRKQSALARHLGDQFDQAPPPTALANIPSTVRKLPKVARPNLRIVTLGDFVRGCWPDAYKDSCEFYVEGRTVYRQKVLAGSVVDCREVGKLPLELRWACLHCNTFEGYVVGDEQSINTAKNIERQEWKAKNRLAVLFGGTGVDHA